MGGFEPFKISDVPGQSGEFSDLEDGSAPFADEDGFAPMGVAGLFSSSSEGFSGFDDASGQATETGSPGTESVGDSALKSVRDEYFEEGRREGLELGRKQVEEELKIALQLRTRLETVRDEVFARSVKDVADAVILIARQVVRRELHAAPSSIEQLVVSVLEQVRRSDEFVIRLSADEHQKLSDLTPVIMERLGVDASFRVEVDPKLEAGGVVVETDYGRIDASVEAQIEAFAAVVDSWAREEVEVNDD